MGLPGNKKKADCKAYLEKTNILPDALSKKIIWEKPGTF